MRKIIFILFFIFTGVSQISVAQRYTYDEDEREKAHKNAREVGNWVISEIFEGGINGKYELIDYRYSGSNSWVKFRLTFNGNIITSNYYSLNVLYGQSKDGLPVFYCDQFNETAWNWWVFKGIVTGLQMYEEYQNSKR
jgi:hypothetical protein